MESGSGSDQSVILRVNAIKSLSREGGAPNNWLLLAEWDDEYGRENISSYLPPAAFAVERRNVMTAAYNEVESDESEREVMSAAVILHLEPLNFAIDAIVGTSNRIEFGNC